MITTYAQHLVQIKVFDEQMRPLATTSFKVDDSDVIITNRAGVAFVELPTASLPPSRIIPTEPTLEAASWNYSKGVLEVVLKKKNYHTITISLHDEGSRPLIRIPFVFHGTKPIESQTDESGMAKINVPLGYNFSSANLYSVSGFVVRDIETEGDHVLLRLDKVERAAAGEREDTRERALTRAAVDTITSLTSFFTLMSQLDGRNLSNEERLILESKMDELMERAQSSNPSYTNQISASSDLKEDIQNVLRQVEAEQAGYEELLAELNDKINIINSKMQTSPEKLDKDTRVQLLSDIEKLELILASNKKVFNKNHTDYLELLRGLKRNLMDLTSLEEQLEVSETQRLEEQRIFRERLISISLVTGLLVAIVMLLVYFTTKLRRQQKQLIAANGEIKHINENLERIVAERTNSLLETNFELDTFLYRSSHDLRGPIRSILGLCHIASRNDVPDQEVLIGKIADTARRMDNMSRKLSMLSEVNRPGERELVNIYDAVVNVLKYFETEISKRRIKVELGIPESTQISSHSQLIHIILFNIIENAVLYSGLRDVEKPTIKVTALALPDRVILNVFDNGVGICHDSLNRIWDMFYIGNYHSRGNGLGLYIVKRAVQTLKGAISVETEENKFSNFLIAIPNGTDTEERRAIGSNNSLQTIR